MLHRTLDLGKREASGGTDLTKTGLFRSLLKQTFSGVTSGTGPEQTRVYTMGEQVRR